MKKLIVVGGLACLVMVSTTIKPKKKQDKEIATSIEGLSSVETAPNINALLAKLPENPQDRERKIKQLIALFKKMKLSYLQEKKQGNNDALTASRIPELQQMIDQLEKQL